MLEFTDGGIKMFIDLLLFFLLPVVILIYVFFVRFFSNEDDNLFYIPSDNEVVRLVEYHDNIKVISFKNHSSINVIPYIIVDEKNKLLNLELFVKEVQVQSIKNFSLVTYKYFPTFLPKSMLSPKNMDNISFYKVDNKKLTITLSKKDFENIQLLDNIHFLNMVIANEEQFIYTLNKKDLKLLLHSYREISQYLNQGYSYCSDFEICKSKSVA